MSIMAAPTRGFQIGVRKSQTRRGLAGERTPAQIPAFNAYSTTHPVYRGLHGMGAAPNYPAGVEAPVIFNPMGARWGGAPFAVPTSNIPAASAASGTASTAATPASTTPVAQPTAPHIVRRMWGRMPQPSSAPSNPTQGQTYTDTAGNVWTFSGTAWTLTSPGASMQTTPTPQTSSTTPPATSVALTSGAATTAQAGTPVPVNWPTTQTYTDSSGNIWGYENGSWQIISYVAGSAAATQAATLAAATGTTTGGVSVSTTTSDWMASLTSFLQGSTIINGVQNFWLVGGAGVVALLLMRSGGKR